jgi:hypothetical protein
VIFSRHECREKELQNLLNLSLFWHSAIIQLKVKILLINSFHQRSENKNISPKNISDLPCNALKQKI